MAVPSRPLWETLSALLSQQASPAAVPAVPAVPGVSAAVPAEPVGSRVSQRGRFNKDLWGQIMALMNGPSPFETFTGSSNEMRGRLNAWGALPAGPVAGVSAAPVAAPVVSAPAEVPSLNMQASPSLFGPNTAGFPMLDSLLRKSVPTLPSN